MPYYGSLRTITNALLIDTLNGSANDTGIVTSSSQYAPTDLVSGIREVFYISATNISVVIHGIDTTGIYAEWYRYYNGTVWTDWFKNATTADRCYCMACAANTRYRYHTPSGQSCILGIAFYNNPDAGMHVTIFKMYAECRLFTHVVCGNNLCVQDDPGIKFTNGVFVLCVGGDLYKP